MKVKINTKMAEGTGKVIRISAEVEKRLSIRGKFGDSFNDIIERLLDEVEKKEKKQ
jgi:predicted CopG family antitoxin